jgi:hypothetical protein
LKHTARGIPKRFILPLFLALFVARQVKSDPIPIMVFPFDGAEAEENRSLSGLLVNAIRDQGNFSPELQAQAPETPDLPPSQSAFPQYGVTAMLYPDEEETHAQIWIWDLPEERLIVTDEMVYADAEGAAEYMSALVSWLLSRIPASPETPAARGAEPEPALAEAADVDPAAAESVSAAVEPGQEVPPEGEPADTRGTPSGEEAPKKGPRQPIYSYLSAEYISLFPVYGSNGVFFGSRFQPIGVGLRFSVLPINLPLGAIGFELSGFWNYLSAHGDLFDATGHFIGVVFNVVYQLPLPNRNFSFVFRGGGGTASIPGARYAYSDGSSYRQTPEEISFWPLINGGASFRAIVFRNFFAELGGEFSGFFMADSAMGNIRAHLGLGLQLGGKRK